MKLVSPRYPTRLLGTLSILGVLSLGGCTSWHSSGTLPGLNKWNDERAIIKKAQNDPFPSPQQVGLK